MGRHVPASKRALALRTSVTTSHVTCYFTVYAEALFFDEDIISVYVCVRSFGGRCGWCQKLAPQFEKAATILKNNHPKVVLIEVNPSTISDVTWTNF